MNYVVDTHVLIWYFIGSKRLKRSLRQALDDCRRRGGRLLIPTIVLAEARAGLITKDKIIRESGEVETL